MLKIETCRLQVGGIEVGGHRMLTIGRDTCGVRVTMGKLDRRGKWHAHRPDIFLLWRDRRIG